MNVTEEKIRARTEEIRFKRIAQLEGRWKFMCQRYKECRENAALNDALVAEVVEAYLKDRQALVNRANIAGRIQRHKIAGLMTAAIVKTRPVQLHVSDTRGARISRDNEA